MTRVPLDIAAKIGECSPDTIRTWVRRGHINRYDDGYEITEILHWVDQSRQGMSHTEANAFGHHKRWHTNRGRYVTACPHCASQMEGSNSMSDLAEFLLARITEDEAMVPERERAEDYGTGFNLDTITVEVSCPRWLAECEAKLRIVERHRGCGSGHGYCDDGGHSWRYEYGGHPDMGCPDLGDLAHPYADHPDFREEWRP